MKRTPLSRIKLIWRDQTAADLKLTPATFRLAYQLADFVTMKETVEKYSKNGKIYVWPSQSCLAARTNLSLDTIRIALAQLKERGHLRRVKKGNQYSGSNKYRLIVKEMPNESR